MKLEADERGRIACAELFRPKAVFEAQVEPDGSIRLVELVEPEAVPKPGLCAETEELTSKRPNN